MASELLLVYCTLSPVLSGIFSTPPLSTWNAAKLYCEQQQAHLAYFETQSDVIALSSYCPDSGGSTYCYLGFEDITNDGICEFQFLDGTAMNQLLFDWSGAEPDHCRFANQPNAMGGILIITNSVTYELGDISKTDIYNWRGLCDDSTNEPTNIPTNIPTHIPTNTPTNSPIITTTPTITPTVMTTIPTNLPTVTPLTESPTDKPTNEPTNEPTKQIIADIVYNSTFVPTITPSKLQESDGYHWNVFVLNLIVMWTFEQCLCFL